MEGKDSNRFQNKYLINSTRKDNWDYSFPGLYFVTICTDKRKNLLGEVKNGIMGLNMVGCVVNREWLRTGELRDNIRLDEFIIMPNHIHGIIEILEDISQKDVETPRWGVYKNSKTSQRGVSTERASQNWKSNSLGTIINQFKGVCTKKVHRLNHKNFHWQPRYYEHIIRTDTESLEKIRWYIKYNPVYWHRDRNNINI